MTISTAGSTTSLVSGREAAALLASVGLARESTASVLAAGFAGTPQRVGGTDLYERSAIEALLGLEVEVSELPDDMLRGTFVARVGGRSRRQRQGRPPTPLRQPPPPPALHVDHPRETLRDETRVSYRLGIMSRLAISMLIAKHGFVPFIATVGGFVLTGGDITRMLPASGNRPHNIDMALDPPGEWYDAVHRRRVPTPPGGPWTMLPGDFWTTPVDLRG